MRRFIFDETLLVMSRREAEALFSVPTNSDIACISITDNNAPEANLRFCNRRLNLSFDDVERDDVAAMAHGLVPISTRQAEEVVRFAQSTTGPLVVHCEAGISRSAGVAAGLLALNEESDERDLYVRTVPNATCKVRVLRAGLKSERQRKERGEHADGR